MSFSEGRKVIVKEVVEPNDTKATETSQLYRNPTFLGVLIGVCALIVIVIVCLLLVAFRAGHLNADKIQGTVLVQKSLVSYNKRRALSTVKTGRPDHCPTGQFDSEIGFSESFC